MNTEVGLLFFAAGCAVAIFSGAVAVCEWCRRIIDRSNHGSR